MSVTVTNDAEISFGTPSATWGTPSHIVIREGTNMRQIVELDGSPAATEVNREVVIPAGDLDIVFASSSDGLTDANLVRILNGYFDDMALTISLHTGDPGSGFNQNTISGNGYSDASLSAGALTASDT